MQKSNSITKSIAWLTAILVLLIAFSSFIISFNALLSFAQLNGLTKNLSILWALIIDLCMVIFSLAVVNAHLQKESTRKQWLLTITYFILTITFNSLHASDNLESKFVAIIAPISLFFSFELLMSQLKSNVNRYQLGSDISELTEIFNVKRKELSKIESQIVNAKEKLTEISSTRKTKRTKELVKILKKSPDISVSDLSERLNVSRPTTYNDLSELENEGILQKNGNGWEITK